MHTRSKQENSNGARDCVKNIHPHQAGEKGSDMSWHNFTFRFTPFCWETDSRPPRRVGSLKTTPPSRHHLHARLWTCHEWQWMENESVVNSAVLCELPVAVLRCAMAMTPRLLLCLFSVEPARLPHVIQAPLPPPMPHA